jgi:demethylmenaquinone methyltransferase/2-methoxy-6-polyprenyl-1,4-benzoquinol methylase
MFSSIASNYDFLNTLLSFNRDKCWRRFAASKIELRSGAKILDVATGTGSLALELAMRADKGRKVIGVDFSQEMLSKAKDKLTKIQCDNLELIQAKAEALPFPDNTFDYTAIGFGLRNMTDIEQTLWEMARVTKVGGRLICLEFSQPQRLIFRQIYKFYIFHILPFIGGIVSKNKEAYAYLPQSIVKFPSFLELKGIIRKLGLRDIVAYPLTLGIATVYVAIKEAT